MSLQLYQVDYKSYLLDFKSLPLKDEESNMESSPGSTTGGEQKAEENVKNNEDSNPAPGGHHTMEFFEMCAALITQLAR